MKFGHGTIAVGFVALCAACSSSSSVIDPQRDASTTVRDASVDHVDGASATFGDDASEGEDAGEDANTNDVTTPAIDAGDDATVANDAAPLDAASDAGDAQAIDAAPELDAAAEAFCKMPVNVAPFVYRRSHHPNAPQANQCTANEVTTLASDCQGDAVTGALSTQCVSDEATVSTTCSACVFSQDTDESWGPIVSSTNDGGSLNGDLSELNLAGCIDDVTGIDDCGDEYIETYSCLYEACQLNAGEACVDADDHTAQICLNAAQEGTCAGHITITNDCNDAIFMTYQDQLNAQCFGATPTAAYTNELTEFCVTP